MENETKTNDTNAKISTLIKEIDATLATLNSNMKNIVDTINRVLPAAEELRKLRNELRKLREDVANSNSGVTQIVYHNFRNHDESIEAKLNSLFNSFFM